MADKRTIISGSLEIDHERGVIYFHTAIRALKTGLCPTPLHICGLGPIEFPLQDRQVDVTIHPDGQKVGIQK